jgi:hypothetical protein
MLFILERLSVTPRSPDGSREPLDPIVAAMAQVQRIAATSRRVDDTVAQVPWGMSATTTIGAHASLRIEAYADELRRAIARYEPRLQSLMVDVERTADPLSPSRLLVTAVFPGEEQPRGLRVPAPY